MADRLRGGGTVPADGGAVPALRLGVAAAGGSRGGGMDRLGPMRQDELRTRLLMLFPLAAALGFMVLGKCFPATLVKSTSRQSGSMIGFPR